MNNLLDEINNLKEKTLEIENLNKELEKEKIEKCLYYENEIDDIKIKHKKNINELLFNHENEISKLKNEIKKLKIDVLKKDETNNNYQIQVNKIKLESSTFELNHSRFINNNNYDNSNKEEIENYQNEIKNYKIENKKFKTTINFLTKNNKELTKKLQEEIFKKNKIIGLDKSVCTNITNIGVLDNFNTNLRIKNELFNLKTKIKNKFIQNNDNIINKINLIFNLISIEISNIDNKILNLNKSIINLKNKFKPKSKKLFVDKNSKNQFKFIYYKK